MSVGKLCFAIAAILLFLVGFNVVESTKYNLETIGLFFIALGLLLDFWLIPVDIRRP